MTVTPMDAYDTGTPVTSDTATVANSLPTDLHLSANSVLENKPTDTTVGTFSADDPDEGENITFTLVSGAGDDGNASFTIDGNTLKTAASFDFESQSSYSIRVRATDASSAYFEKTFTIDVHDELPDLNGDVNSAVLYSDVIELNVAEFDSFLFTGVSDDLAILIGANDQVNKVVTETYWQTTLPTNYILYRDTYGWLGTGSGTYDIILTDGTNTFTWHRENGEGNHVQDAQAEGIASRKWGTLVTAAELESNSWVTNGIAQVRRASFREGEEHHLAVHQRRPEPRRYVGLQAGVAAARRPGTRGVRSQYRLLSRSGRADHALAVPLSAARAVRQACVRYFP